MCVVGEYRNLSDIEQSVGSIVRYHTDFGVHIDESHAALIIIKDRIAHAVLVPNRLVLLGANEHTPCYRIEFAQIERVELSGYRTPIAGLVGAK